MRALSSGIWFVCLLLAVFATLSTAANAGRWKRGCCGGGGNSNCIPIIAINGYYPAKPSLQRAENFCKFFNQMFADDGRCYYYQTG